MRLLQGILLLLCLLGTGCGADEPPPLFYSAKAIRGTVVDAATGQPLPGVIVVAQWVQHLALSGTPHRLQVFETVTDAQGSYQFPAWGPKLNTRFPLGSFDFWAPALSIFTPAYKPDGRSNEWMSHEAALSSDWDGKTIKLERFTGTDDEWADALNSLQIRLDWAPGMDWRRLPRMTLALELERVKLEKKPLKVSNPTGLYAFGTTIEEVRKFLEERK